MNHLWWFLAMKSHTPRRWIAWAPSRQIGLGCLPLMACTTAFCSLLYCIIFIHHYTYFFCVLRHSNVCACAIETASASRWRMCVTLKNINCRILSGRAIVVGSLIMLLYTKRSSLYAHSCTTPISLSIRIEADGFMTCAGQCMMVFVD